MTPRYSLIIFDWDGTLAKSLHLWLTGFRTSLAAQDHHIPDHIITQHFFTELDQTEKQYPTLDMELLILKTREYIHINSHELELYPGVPQTLDALRDTPLALVSSSPRMILETSLFANNLIPHFSSIIAGDDGKQYKPHPEAFLATIEHHGVSPEQTLIIGDTHTDIMAGHAAGAHTCFFAPDENALFHDFSKTRALTPHYEISSLTELLTIQNGTRA